MQRPGRWEPAQPATCPLQSAPLLPACRVACSGIPPDCNQPLHSIYSSCFSEQRGALHHHDTYTRHTATHCPAALQFDGDRDAAVARLLEVVTGGNFELGLIESFGGIKQTDAAVYIAKGVLAVATGASLGRCAWGCGWGDWWQAGWRVSG